MKKKIKDPADFMKVFASKDETKFKKLYDETNSSNYVLEDIQHRIEKLFVINMNEYYYIIPYILHDIYNNGLFIKHGDLKYIKYLHPTEKCSPIKNVLKRIPGISKFFPMIGGYSSRRAPKKRIVTIKRVKVTK
jgi:hypothetical protein